MSSTSWRGTALFTTILVVMGATVGLKLYGIGEQVAASPAAAASTSASSAAGTTTGGSTTTSTPSSTPSSTATSTPSASASAPAAAAAPAATKVVTGTAIDTRYGPVQVKVTFTGTAITAIDTVQYPNGDGRDTEINDRALPILQQEALSSQSANIDTVSGATYTSEGYIQSLQSAIDQR